MDEQAGESSLTVLVGNVLELLARRSLTADQFDPRSLHHALAQVVDTFTEWVGDGYSIKLGSGVGTPADVPWVGIFPAGSRTTATEGIYLVLLFARDGSACYLSLNQGTEKVTGGSRVLQKRVLDIRRVVEAGPAFEVGLDLRSNNERPRRYANGSAYAMAYSAGAVPSDDVLRSDLESALGWLKRVERSGLRWHPEIEPMHLLFKWNADAEPRTIDIHREIADAEGSVWWGRFADPTRSTLADSKQKQLRRQLDNDVRTSAFLYRRGSLWRTRVVDVSASPPDPKDTRFPGYYHPGDCNYFTLLTDFEKLPADWATNHLVMEKDPGEPPSRLEAALGNQTTPMFVYELFDSGSPASQPREPSSIFAAPHVALEGTLETVVERFSSALRAAHVDYGERHEELVRRFVCSLATKRFLILTGLSGSGKTRLAQAFGEWLGEGKSRVVAVRPDWTSPDYLLGYVNELVSEKDRKVWSVPETLEFMLQAARNPGQPHLLILDEMNLAHVERYFADVLSGIESGKPVLPNLEQVNGVWQPSAGARLIELPTNLLIVGTVNVDETTYMFSPKVLDRANTIEFRVETGDLGRTQRRPAALTQGSAGLVARFLNDAEAEIEVDPSSDMGDRLKSVHELLSSTGREFGHRTFAEALEFEKVYMSAGGRSSLDAFDVQLCQKVLPRLHGSKREIGPLLEALVEFTANDFPLSHEKLERMKARLDAVHFVSFAE